MQLTALVVSALALAPVGCLAWAKDGSTGAWVANDNWYEHLNGYRWVHESCTTMNSRKTHEGGYCAFWTDSKGTKRKGFCNKTKDNWLECKRGCPDPWVTCVKQEEDGGCTFGYATCLENLACNNDPGGAECIGTSIGCAHCAKYNPWSK